MRVILHRDKRIKIEHISQTLQFIFIKWRLYYNYGLYMFLFIKY